MSLQTEATVSAQGMAVCQPGAARSLKELAERADDVLLWENKRVDVESPQGRYALAVLLSALHTTSQRLEIVQAAREYRETLSERVRAIWTDAACLYHIGIVTKSAHGEVYFNSRAYPLSDDAMALSCQLAGRLSEALALLGRLRSTNAENLTVSDVDEVRACLAMFDEAWASFEERFFLELLSIEAQARSILVEAVELVMELDRIAGAYGEDPDPNFIFMQDSEFLKKHTHLIDCIAQLNSQAIPGSAARSFSPAVLQQSEMVVEDCFERGADRRSSVYVLASDAVLAWDHLCCYLFQNAHCVDSFSPNIRANKTLAKLLEDWALSWTLAEAYIVDVKGRVALHTVVQYVDQAKAMAPSLVSMMDDQSAQLFLVLPRLFLLCFLEDPLCIATLLAQLLPHQFEQPRDNSESGLSFSPGSDLVAFMDAYKLTSNLLGFVASAATRRDGGDAQAFIQAVFTNGLVDGVGDSSIPMTEGVFDGPAGSKAREAWKAFALTLERWSIELQRHCAEDWNNFIATLVRCLEA